jgi:ATP/maltotriose-dependent transcriptional regulator MalT
MAAYPFLFRRLRWAPLHRSARPDEPASLRFTLDEARALFAASGVELPESALTPLHARTEGWAAGLRLAALSLAWHPDPERFAAEFSGSERTVAEYLLAEVLERQNEEVRRLLLRTSVLERVSGELADLLTGGSNGERILQDLEDAGAFVVSLDGRRSWFRYHRLFADLLQLELRRSEPGQLPALHVAAAGWYAGHGYPAEAVRHAQAAKELTALMAGELAQGGSHPRLIEPLTQGQARVLRYLPTNLSAPEIARELSLSVTTVRTHVRHIFAKLGANHRTEAVERARALGLLAPSLALPRAGRTHRFAWDS